MGTGLSLLPGNRKLAAGMSDSGVVLLVSHQRGCTLRRGRRLSVPLLRQVPAPEAQRLPVSDGRELASSLACREDQMPSTVPYRELVLR